MKQFSHLVERRDAVPIMGIVPPMAILMTGLVALWMPNGWGHGASGKRLPGKVCRDSGTLLPRTW
jgi:hypothetical protein